MLRATLLPIVFVSVSVLGCRRSGETKNDSPNPQAIPVEIVHQTDVAQPTPTTDTTIKLPQTESPFANRIFHANNMDQYLPIRRRLAVSDATGWILSPQRNSASVVKLVSIDASELGFTAADACAECHPEYYDGFKETAHYRTSALATAGHVLGHFESGTGENQLVTAHPDLTFEMAQQNDAYVVTAKLTNGEHTHYHSAQLDIVLGSGNHGQSFLTWTGQGLYMLPVTYFTPTDSWVNSPGYVDGTADFARPITARCLECHSTYFQAADTANRHENRFVGDNFILGISCVRCHGPATDHMTFHRAHRAAVEAHDIVHPGNLSSAESIAVCAQCHSGIGVPREPSFTYLPGRDLAEHLELNTGPEAHQAGVHTANQYARLKLSKCFQQSDSMTCATCHDPHEHEHGDEKRFARRCLTCHESDDCPPISRSPTALVHRCITCHMREEAFADISVVADGQRRTPRMHDHKIRVWQEHSRDLLQQWGIR